LSRKALLVLMLVKVKQCITGHFKQTLKCLNLKLFQSIKHSTHQIIIYKDGGSVIHMNSPHHERSIWHNAEDQPKAEITLQQMKAMTC